MARRKRPPEPVTEGLELPAKLRRDVVTVEQFVPWSEQPPTWHRSGEHDPAPYPSWRRIRALRRWQAAVTEWAAGQDLDRRALMRLGYWPGRPPRFGDTSRVAGQRFY